MKKTIIHLIAVIIVLAGAGKALPSEPNRFRDGRLAMVESQIIARGVSDPGVLDAMKTVPRHMFVPPGQVNRAYDDRPLSIGFGQTISQPYIVAYMTEVLDLSGTERVLEIGTGSGYQAAILAETAGDVYSMEIITPLYESARERLARLGYNQVRLKPGDGYYGWPENGPFDAIIVTCAAAHIPPPLIRQLKPGGRMVIPVGRPWSFQSLVLAVKNREGNVTTRSLLDVRFVPLVRAGEETDSGAAKP
jgi:protein-L-isoaspartate(D-aspartate) O-methyltransferase